MIRICNWVFLALAAGWITACGGGGGGGGSSAGIDGTGVTGGPGIVAVGTVTGFGSVIVNGVRYETTSTRFEIDGSVGVQSDLAVGDVVVVVGNLNQNSSATGVATDIFFDDLVEGPIASGSIDLVAGTFEVLGQTVVVTADTSFDDSIQPASLEGLTDGDIVEVSGFRRADGSIDATRIEPKPPGLEFEVTGIVTNLDDVSFTFAVNSLTVDYSGAAIDDFAGGAVVAGALVEVKGMTIGASGELIATRVENKGNDIAKDDGDRAEIEGLITRFVNPTDFDVAGLAVTTTAQTRYEGGTAADLGLNIKVEVEGAFNASGVLVATKVDIRRGNFVRVTASVDSVNTAADSFVVLGIEVDTDSLTRFEDKSDQDVSPFTVDDLFVGDYVEVRGSEFPTGTILAGLIERDDSDDPKVELRGFVTSENGSEIVILGVTISTTGAVFRDQNDAPISAAEFFNRIGEGSLVDVDGDEVGDRQIAADEVEIEIE